MSYVARYKNLSHVLIYADSALAAAEEGRYMAGKCDALHNKAFYALARMHYTETDSLLGISLDEAPDNISKLCSEVLYMRLCQRRSQNKDFYIHKFQAERLISRIKNNLRSLTPRQREQYTWARTEYGISLSTYLYYVGREKESKDALNQIVEDNDIYLQSDTAQWLAYLYNVGAGGIVEDTIPERIQTREFDFLIQCYMSASHLGYSYWEANSLQALSEHINTNEKLENIQRADAGAVRYLNDIGVPDSLLSRRLAERALEIFVRHGYVYQSAAAWRSLADTYLRENDYEAMRNCLLSALSDSLILQAPTIISSVYERLCIAYSAINDKQTSDFLRNQYLDIQDSTRQDRQLAARAESLKEKLVTLNHFVVIIFILLVILGAFTYTLIRYRKKHGMEQRLAGLTEKIEELEENISMLNLQIGNARRLSIEQHAKISLVQSLQPLIDRMHIATKQGTGNERSMEYIRELCGSIEKGNELLTRWIQLSKGNVKLHIETFSVQSLFDLIALNAVSFSTKGISLNIENTDIKIKADRTLSLFLINTLVDNARKFTDEGGTITLSSKPSSVSGYADITIADTGQGMTQDQADHLFEYHVVNDGKENLAEQKSHGFGLMNCRGIIDRYKKTSNLFSQAAITAESEEGKGTRMTFRLPLVTKLIMAILLIPFGHVFARNANTLNAQDASNESKAKTHIVAANAYADSMYQCNIDGKYEDCLYFSDLCRKEINAWYVVSYNKADTIVPDNSNAELSWWRSNVDIDYSLILAMRNETAVAALSLHKWAVYAVNNSAYISLYRECSADSTLNDYYKRMERYESYGNLALIVLIVIIFGIVFIFYYYYVRDIILAKRDYREKIRMLKEAETTLKSEYNRLHISNSIADNCLSTIKHETMYYPARIARLIDNISTEDTENMLIETVSFYRTLYVTLSSHCQKLLSDAPVQIAPIPFASLMENNSSLIECDCETTTISDTNILGNEELLHYLLLILKKKNAAPITLSKVEKDNSGYLRLTFVCSGINITEEQLSTIFHAQTSDVDFLIIKQILREIGDRTFCYGSGITSYITAEGTVFCISLPIQTS